MKKITAQLLNCYIAKLLKKQFNNLTIQQSNNYGFSSLAAVALLGLLMALFLGLVGTGVVRLPGNAGIPTSPIPISDPVEDDEACNDQFNADCEKFLENDPEDLTPEDIQRALQED